MIAQNREIDLWASDEVHFQLFGSRCKMWVPPEDKDPVVLHHPTRKSVGYFGAVRLRDGKFVYLGEAGSFNAESFHSFAKYLRCRSFQSGRRTIVIEDNVRYHHAKLHKQWREACADRFALDFLPPYSPDLNPIERVWKLTRRKCLHNRYFGDLEEITKTVETLFNQWRQSSETLRKLCAIV